MFLCLCPRPCVSVTLCACAVYSSSEIAFLPPEEGRREVVEERRRETSRNPHSPSDTNTGGALTQTHTQVPHCGIQTHTAPVMPTQEEPLRSHSAVPFCGMQTHTTQIFPTQEGPLLTHTEVPHCGHQTHTAPVMPTQEGHLLMHFEVPHCGIQTHTGGAFTFTHRSTPLRLHLDEYKRNYPMEGNCNVPASPCELGARRFSYVPSQVSGGGVRVIRVCMKPAAPLWLRFGIVELSPYGQFVVIAVAVDVCLGEWCGVGYGGGGGVGWMSVLTTGLKAKQI